MVKNSIIASVISRARIILFPVLQYAIYVFLKMANS